MNLKQLTERLQSDQLNTLNVLPSPFSDSSHHIVLQKFGDRIEVVKGLRDQAQQSPFWQGIDRLFDVSLSQQIALFETSYPWLAQHTPIRLPRWLETFFNDQGQADAVRSSFLAGQGVQTEQVDQAIVEQLAKHLYSWHQLSSVRFGCLQQPQGERQSWPTHLHDYLQTLSEASSGDRQLKQQSLQQLSEQPEAFIPEQFGVIMPDLRWDQFLVAEGQLALTDLDAVVFGPVALEWVLLEGLLTEQQACWFLQAYPGRPPNLAPVRQVYRAVLSQLQVFGKQNAQAWLNLPTWFE